MKRRRKRIAFSETGIKYLLIGAAIALLVMTGLVSALGDKAPAQFPFGHIYRVSAAACPPGRTMAVEETPVVYLTADGQLLLESRDGLTFSDGGRLEREEEGWRAVPRDNKSRAYRLRLEDGEQVTLSLTEKGETWTYTLSRVDKLLCTLASGDTLQPRWFAPGVYDSGSFDLPAITVAEGEPLVFTVEEPDTDSLAMITPDGQHHTLDIDDEGRFTVPAQEDVYRVAMDNGEYIFRVHIS